MGWNAMCGAGRTESIWDGSVLEVGKRKGDGRREAQCLGPQIGAISDTNKTGGQMGKGEEERW